MTDERLDSIIKQTIPTVIPDVDLKVKIRRGIEEKGGKHLMGKRAATVVLVCCMLVSGITVMAAGIHYMAITKAVQNYRSYRQIDEVAEQIGFIPKIKEEFRNGLRFESMSVTDVECVGYEENQEKESKEYKSVTVHYAKENNVVTLSMSKADDEEKVVLTDGDSVQNIEGVEVRYRLSVMETEVSIVSVKADELLPEDIQDMNGTREMTICSVEWIQEGIYYSLHSLPADISLKEGKSKGIDGISQESLYEMVREIIVME